MIHYFYFVRDMDKATKDTIIYSVKVGSSQREQIKFSLVQEYCRDCGLYFHKVSDISDTAVRNLEKRLFPGSSFFSSPLRRATISISQLYKLIIDDSFESFESNYVQKRGLFYFKSLIDPQFKAKQRQKKSLLPLPSHPRKYLKSGNEDEFYSFLIGSAIMTIIFLIAAYLDGVYVYHIQY